MSKLSMGDVHAASQSVKLYEVCCMIPCFDVPKQQQFDGRWDWALNRSVEGIFV